jgi:hypothetical protein
MRSHKSCLPPHTQWCRIERAAETAHTLNNVVTAAVFHAPMFALNADAERNACIYRSTCAVAHTHRRVSAHTDTSCQTLTERVSATGKPATGRNGAYIRHVDHEGGVPRADVRVERRRTEERLRAGHTLSTAMKSVRLRDVYIRIDMNMDRNRYMHPFLYG